MKSIVIDRNIVLIFMNKTHRFINMEIGYLKDNYW